MPTVRDAVADSSHPGVIRKNREAKTAKTEKQKQRSKTREAFEP
jgi:hypothetical protein